MICLKKYWNFCACLPKKSFSFKGYFQKKRSWDLVKKLLETNNYRWISKLLKKEASFEPWKKLMKKADVCAFSKNDNIKKKKGALEANNYWWINELLEIEESFEIWKKFLKKEETCAFRKMIASRKRKKSLWKQIVIDESASFWKKEAFERTYK